MSLSIVIVSWNTQAHLQQCLSSIQAHPPEGKIEIIVVDNGSQDESTRMIGRLYPDVVQVQNHENVGFAKATNQGINLCKGTHILLLNPDTEIKPKALEILERLLASDSSIGAVGPRLLNPDGTIQPSCFPTPTLFRELWRLFHFDKLVPLATYPLDSWDMENHQEVEIINGACFMIKREALKEVGELDETYFMYSEEVDLCYRLRKAGWKLCWVPGAEVIHFGGQSTRQNKAEMFQQLYRSKILYFRKNQGHSAAKIYKAILIAASLMRLLLTPTYLFVKAQKRHELLVLAENYRNLIPRVFGM